MPRKKKYYTIFLESEEFGREEFTATGWLDAMRTIKDLYGESLIESKEDGIERRVGILASVEVDDTEEDEG